MHSVMGGDHGVWEGRAEDSTVLVIILLRNIIYQSSPPKANIHGIEPRWSPAGGCEIKMSMENRSIAVPSFQHRRAVVVAAQEQKVDLRVHEAVVNRWLGRSFSLPPVRGDGQHLL